MLTIIKKKYISCAKNADQRSGIIAEIIVDNVSELPKSDGVYGYKLLQGSLALVVTENKLAVLSGDGKWYIGGVAIE